MEIKFSLTREDFLAYNSYCLDKSSNAKRYQYIYYPILGLVTMYATSYLLYDSFPSSIFENLSIIILAMIPMVVYKPLRRWDYRWKLDKSIKKGECESAFGESKIILEEDRLTAISSLGEGNVKWDAVKEIEQIRNYIFITIGSTFIIPKRCFSDENSAEQFYNLAKEYSNHL